MLLKRVFRCVAQAFGDIRLPKLTQNPDCLLKENKFGIGFVVGPYPDIPGMKVQSPLRKSTTKSASEALTNISVFLSQLKTAP